jgi:hypothetical protein
MMSSRQRKSPNPVPLMRLHRGISRPNKTPKDLRLLRARDANTVVPYAHLHLRRIGELGQLDLHEPARRAVLDRIAYKIHQHLF